MDRRAKQIDSIFTKLTKGYHFNGCVLYAEKGRLVFKKAYGIGNFKTKEPLTEHSTFQLASVSKMFTAMAIMILYEQGKLDYDDPVEKYIFGLPYPGVTIRHLLNHRSGIPDYMHFTDALWPDKNKAVTNDDIIRLMRMAQPKPYFLPDGGFDYCNSNYALLASVVEKVSQMPFDQYIQQAIFDPVDMQDSFIYRLSPDSAMPANVPCKVSGHLHYRRGIVPIRNDYMNGVIGDKGVYSSIMDLYKWDRALYDGILVSDSTLQEAFSPGSPSSKRRKDNYGFGWRIREDRVKTVFHYGWWKGFRSYFIRDLYQEKTIIVLTNKDRGPSSDYYWDLLDDHRFDLGFVCPVKE